MNLVVCPIVISVTWTCLLVVTDVLVSPPPRWLRCVTVLREKRNREEEKEENETGTVKRRCDGVVSVEAGFEMFISMGRCGDWTCLRTCLIVSRILVRMCVWCLM